MRLPAMSASVPVSRTRPHAASPSPPRPSVEESITKARAKLEADRIAVLSKKQRKLEALQKALEAPDAPAVKDKWGRTIESGEPSRGSAQPASDADLNSTLSPSKGEPKKFGNPFATDIASKAKPMAVILAEYKREVSELEGPERLKQLEESWFVCCHYASLRRAVLLALAPTTPSVHALLASGSQPCTCMALACLTRQEAMLAKNASRWREQKKARHAKPMYRVGRKLKSALCAARNST